MVHARENKQVESMEEGACNFKQGDQGALINQMTLGEELKKGREEVMGTSGGMSLAPRGEQQMEKPLAGAGWWIAGTPVTLVWLQQREQG